MFDRTPIEVISLVFLLVLVYGVAGPSVALFRLNLLFLPIVVLLLVALILMNIGFFEIRNFKPFFAADWRDVVFASKESVFSFMGLKSCCFITRSSISPKK
ncbi:hypothetical protein EHV15_27215 [Paenibacillus oralis]|uniref:Uncharacterized protein n=1 Tax=Paenibacillus oralis TaxID=2490856 RepID=A0A3P3U7B1_9BACL|nr:GerAB/ArcD/ProY family transporter [Paenibacillus oralis]RRJ66195.1 hypothetical protein EHV15_27215 [Paenibacillus oralis]